MVSNEKGLPTKFHPGTRIRRNKLVTFDISTAKNVKWISPLGSKTYSSPAIANGRVFIGTNDAVLEDERFERTQGGVLRCLSENDGSLLWQLVVPRLEIDRWKVSEDFDSLNLGICSTPTVDDGRVYVVSNRCEVLCLDVAGQTNGNDGQFKSEAIFSGGSKMIELTQRDADILWRFDMLRDIPNFPHDAANSCILVHGNYIYVGTSNGVSYESSIRTSPHGSQIGTIPRVNAQGQPNHRKGDATGEVTKPSRFRQGDMMRHVWQKYNVPRLPKFQ